MRKKLVELIQQIVIPFWAGEIADHLLSNDVVPVVRCKDCKRCDGFPEPDNIQPNEIGICKINMMAVKPDDFCSYGERKEGEG